MSKRTHGRQSTTKSARAKTAAARSGNRKTDAAARLSGEQTAAPAAEAPPEQVGPTQETGWTRAVLKRGASERQRSSQGKGKRATGSSIVTPAAASSPPPAATGTARSRSRGSTAAPGRVEATTEAKSEGTSFPIVGVGASAGGLEAFSQILSALPADAGVAVVFVLHLSPHRDSMLATLLSGQAHIPVLQITDGMKIEPNHVYVTPPNAQIDILDGALRLQPRPSDASQHTPVDHFFTALAQAAQSRAIGVVLSGTAADGSFGLREIKAVGGITLAQDPGTAKFDGMPRAAIATGAVDLVLAPRDIALELARISSHPFIRPPSPRSEGDEVPVFEDQLPRIFTLLRGVSGVDFTHYKLPTIRRRLQRRMVLHRITSIDLYVKFLQRNPDEVSALYRDLLIHVTRFFREPESFKGLAELAFPAIIANRHGHDDPIRIWVPGCATGEEPYSVAIALLEALGDGAGGVPIQIFATDVSENAIEFARAGTYPESITTDVSAERLRRFFVRIDGSYRINKGVRDLCVFARQDVTRDPPFSRLDLVVCRNLLIYLAVPLQKRLVSLFHYALKPSGFLMLGAAETAGPAADMFALADKRHRIYSKKSTVSHAEFGFAPHHITQSEGQYGRTQPNVRHGSVQTEANRIILDRFSPPAVLVDQDLQVTYFRGYTGAYLTPAPGEATLNVLKMAREGLLHGLRTAVTEAQQKGMPVRRHGLHVRQNGHTTEVSIEVLPVEGATMGRHFLILFEPDGREGSAKVEDRVRAPRVVKVGKREQVRITQLEEELAASRQYLQSIIQDLEAANEELQSANEEILSSNEELQSTNEELDTAKEELQSTNEELNTVNEELHNRNEELSRSNSDLLNLLSAVQIPIVMVTHDLRIRRFTPMAERILNLIPSDVGRRISDINPNIDCPDLEKLIGESIDRVSTIDREVRDRQGAPYTLRIRPYKSLENRIDGAIVMLFDVDTTRDRNVLSDYVERLASTLIEGANEPLALLDSDLRIRHINIAFERAFGVDGATKATGQPLERLDAKRLNLSELAKLLKTAWSAQTSIDDLALPPRADGDGTRALRINARLLPGFDGHPTALLLRLREE
jgi:two-component system, chemotaxis family, CheB/CheR fusion protein